jgi:hypothetical protein
VFAEQITEYLREARERREVPPPVATPVVQSEVTPPARRAKARKGVMANLLAAAAEEKVDDFLEYVVETPVQDPEPIPTSELQPATVAESQEDDAPELQSEWLSDTAAPSPSPALMPEDSPSALSVIEAPGAPGAHVEQVFASPAPAGPQMPPVNVAVAVSVNVGSAVDMMTPRRPKRPRKAQPVQDEWGFFDPNQCGFPALIAKLDEIAGLDESDN